MNKSLEVRWFSAIGIVRVENDYGVRYYIGAGEGDSEEADLKFIADWGMHFPADAGDVLFGVKR